MDRGYLRRLAGRGLDAFFPGRCLHCQLPSGRSLNLCPGCESELPSLTGACSVCAEPLPAPGVCGHCLAAPPDFSRILAPYHYAPPVDGWVKRFKQRGDLRCGGVLGELLAQYLQQAMPGLAQPDCILAVPLHWRRRFSRGFNQSRELARLVAQRTGVPLHDGLLRRTAPTAHQQSLDRRGRLKNMRKAFSANAGCADLRIAVVDDVVTTGATSRAIATALVAAGAADVQIWAVARTALEK